MTARTRASVGHPIIQKKIDAWRKEAKTKVVHKSPSMIKSFPLSPPGPCPLVLHVHKRQIDFLLKNVHGRRNTQTQTQVPPPPRSWVEGS